MLELGDKRFYGFDFETRDCEHEEIGDYIKVKPGMGIIVKKGTVPSSCFCRFCNRTRPIPPTVNEYMRTGFRTGGVGEKASFLWKVPS